jgi:hypothetical protein
MTLIDETRERLEARLQELQPCVDEAEQIRALLKTMDGSPAEGHADDRPMRHLPAKVRKLQVLGILRENGIVRVKELAEALQVTSGRAVQLVNELEAEGTARRIEGGVEITADGLDLVPPEMEITTVGGWQEVET